VTIGQSAGTEIRPPPAREDLQGSFLTGDQSALSRLRERLLAERLPVLVLQLTLVLAALYRYRIEAGYGFQRIIPLIFGGFIVHALLPLRYRRPFFLSLSFAAIAVVLPFPHSVVLVAVGLGLIGICHLPVAFWARVGLLLFVAAGLASVRAGWMSGSGLSGFQVVVLPVLGSIFMFRLAIYLYDLRHETKPASISERLSYFFLLPNVCFLLFPVVDYQTYRRTYYNETEAAIYQKGLLWMVRGLTHLLLYRLIYQFLVPAPADVQDLGTVVVFMVTSYLLYLRISGQFHLIVGILCLFGFNLPETHHLYYFASSYIDLWRRINIYWKDFVMKMLYYPAFVRLKNRGGIATRIVLSTAVVFASTWLLHSYQWLWLQGSFPLTATDGVFWAFLGLMVIINSLLEVRGPKRRSPGWSLRGAVVRSSRTIGLFVAMSVAWSFWSSASPGAWLATVSNARSSTPGQVIFLLGLILAAVALGVLLQYVFERPAKTSVARRPALVFRPALYTFSVAFALSFVTLPGVREQAGPGAQSFIEALRRDRLNMADRDLAERGYYEGLLDAGRFTSALSAARGGKPKGREWVFMRASNVVRPRDDYFEYELKPSYEGTYKDAPFLTNRWGMRDEEYDLQKPPGTYRIALLGASYELGAGVNHDQTFEAVLEEELNRLDAGGEHDHYEVLNFSVGGYSLVHKAMLVDTKIGAFSPDLILLTIYSTEELRLLTHMANMVSAGRKVPYPPLEEVLHRAGVLPTMERDEIRERIEPYAYEIMGWTLRYMFATSQELDLPMLALFVPIVDDFESATNRERHQRLRRLALDAGLDVASLDGVYGDTDRSELQVAPWDHHLSVRGHRLVADGLYQLLREYQPGPLGGTPANESLP